MTLSRLVCFMKWHWQFLVFFKKNALAISSLLLEVGICHFLSAFRKGHLQCRVCCFKKALVISRVLFDLSASFFSVWRRCCCSYSHNDVLQVAQRNVSIVAHTQHRVCCLETCWSRSFIVAEFHMQLSGGPISLK